MGNSEHLEILKEGVEGWNKWRHENSDVEPELSLVCMPGANFTCANFAGVILTGANLFNTNLTGADLSKACLNKARLQGANLAGAKLSGADLSGAELLGANLDGADLSGAFLLGTDLLAASLVGANLTGANLTGADLGGANLSGANLSRSKLYEANCVKTNFSQADIENSWIFGISIWDIKKEGLKQDNLIISQEGEPVITVDNLEVAQFIYLLLNNEKIRDLIGTISKKGVLILGRFTPERKKILDAIREKLREHDFVPMMFDFEKVQTRDFTETIKILAGLSRFVIADISEPKSSPLELQATIPDYQIPFLSIIQKGEKPFSMFNDLGKYPWVLETIEYDSEMQLMEHFKKVIIDRALNRVTEIFENKMHSDKPIKNIRDLI